jgi:hypothetical protein
MSSIISDLGGKRELMDSSPQHASSISDEFSTPLLKEQEVDIEETEPHIHLPNPSYWPILLGLAIAVMMVGLLFISSAPWIVPIAVVLVLVCILGWALEDPMTPLKEKFVTVYQAVKVDPWRFKIGQGVIDARGKWLGRIQARFSRYLLVERGSFLPKVYYVPQSAVGDQSRDDTVFLTLSEEDLVRMQLDRLPDDLYDELSDAGVPRVRGIPQFARRPLSPAETGHYNYGKNWPGMNTDASGSYHREEVLPQPRDYVTEGVYTTDEPIPPRVINPD